MKWNYVTKNNFFDSIQNGVWQTFIDCVLDAGFDIKTKWSDGYTVLSFAAEYGNREIVEYLVQKGADGNVQNHDGTKPLHIAAQYGHKDVVEFFVNLGVFIDSRDNNNRTPLLCASEIFHRQYITTVGEICEDSEIHMELARFLLANGANIDACDDEGYLPILLAAKNSCVHVVKMLLIFNAKAECCDEQKWTVLHYAAQNGWLNVAQSLVDKGCNINAKTRSDDTPLMLALQNSQRDAFDLLIESGASLKCCLSSRNRTLHNFCQNGWQDIVQSLAELGYDINAEDNDGDPPSLIAAHKNLVDAKAGCCDKRRWTVLHYASQNGWLDVIQSLVDKGCDVDAKTHSDDTPIMLALQNSHRAVFDLLLESGANLKCCHSGRNTMLHHACQNGWLDVVQSLVERGFDINAEDNDGNTPILIAAQRSYKNIVEMFFKLGAHLKCCNLKKWTLLHYSCMKGWLDVVKFLMEAGCDIDAKTLNGETPLFIAALFSCFDIIYHLIEGGVDVKAKIRIYYSHSDEDFDSSDEGQAWILLHHASSNGWFEIVQRLIKKGIDINEIDFNGDTALHLAIMYNELEIVKYLLISGADCRIENDNYENALQCLIKSGLADTEMITSFLENGSCIQHHDYNTLSRFVFFKERILQDARLCTQAILNEFNNVDLVKVYQEPEAVEYLPPIERMKIRNNGNVLHCIEQSVRDEIETNGYCNIVEVRPIALSLLAVRSFINTKVRFPIFVMNN